MHSMWTMFGFTARNLFVTEFTLPHIMVLHQSVSRPMHILSGNCLSSKNFFKAVKIASAVPDSNKIKPKKWIQFSVPLHYNIELLATQSCFSVVISVLSSIINEKGSRVYL